MLIFMNGLIILFLFQTDGSVPNTLVIANCEVVKPRVAAAEHISQVGSVNFFFIKPFPLHLAFTFIVKFYDYQVPFHLKKLKLL